MELGVVEREQHSHEHLEYPLVGRFVGGYGIDHLDDGETGADARVIVTQVGHALEVRDVLGDPQVAASLDEVDLDVTHGFEGPTHPARGLAHSLGEHAQLAVVARPEHDDTIGLT